MPRPTLTVAGSLEGYAGEVAPNAVPLHYILDLFRRNLWSKQKPTGFADRVFLIRAQTGSGKSTALPHALFTLLRGAGVPPERPYSGPGVVVVQPRVLTAQTIPRELDAADWAPELAMGRTMGFATGAANEKPPTGLIYCTVGVLLQQMRAAERSVGGEADFMARYRFIMVDEAHSRTLDLDFLIYALKAFLTKHSGNPQLPYVLLASATLPTEKYRAYFGLPPQNLVEVRGRAYPIATFWPPTGTRNYLKEAAVVAERIHRENPDDPPERADILVFMPGKREIDQVIQALAAANRAYLAPGGTLAPFLLLAITRDEVQTEGTDFRRLVTPLSEIYLPPAEWGGEGGGELRRPMRKIIVSTVVAETGLTLPQLKYVIDSGWNRQPECYFPGRATGLMTKPAPQSRILQRKGRAGRLFPGEFHPLYTEETYEALVAVQPPDIQFEPLGQHFFPLVQGTAAANGGVFRVGDIDLLDPPPADSLAAELETAVSAGFLMADPAAGGHRLAPMGELAAGCGGLEMPAVATLLAGFLWDVSLLDLAVVVALYGENAPPLHRALAGSGRVFPEGAFRAGLPAFFREGPETERAAAQARYHLSDEFLETLLVFESYVGALELHAGDPGRLAEWCRSAGLLQAAALRLAKAREAVLTAVARAGLNPFWGYGRRLAAAPNLEEFRATAARLKRCIFAGLAPCGYLRRSGVKYRTRGGEELTPPPAWSGVALEALRRAAGAGAAPPPRALATNRVLLKPARAAPGEKAAPLLWQLEPALVSVLDGAVADDAVLWAPRRGGAGAAGPAAHAPDGAPAADPGETPPRERIVAYHAILRAAAAPVGGVEEPAEGPAPDPGTQEGARASQRSSSSAENAPETASENSSGGSRPSGES